MINPEEIARENNFYTVEVSFAFGWRWSVVVHGKGIGEFGCEFGYGDSPEKALADVLNKIAAARREKAEIAAGNKAAKARRIAEIERELADLKGMAA